MQDQEVQPVDGPLRSEAWRLHKRIFDAIDPGLSMGCDQCGDEDCNCKIDTAVGALLGVIWEHCPAEWYMQIIGRPAPHCVADGRCWSCDSEYPCATVRTVGVELGVIKE